MTISIQQQVDFLWKKLGYNVAKTDTTVNKDATNESIPSSPFLPGDQIWSQSDLIPPIIQSTNSDIVHVYNDTTSVECVMDITASANRTWMTGLTDWISFQYGSTYQVKVYLDDAGALNPTLTGIRLYAAGSNNDDEWFFDYESGVLNFLGENLPNQIFTNKKIYVCGARYVGLKGFGQLTAGLTSNLTLSGTTISSTGNIVLQPASGSNINVSGSSITNLGYSTEPTAAATTQYVIDQINALHPNSIWQGDSIVSLSDPTANAGIFTVTIDGNIMSTITNTDINFSNLTINNTTLSSLSSIVLQPGATDIVSVNSTTAFMVPVGTSSQRPLTASRGAVRFNTTTNQFECFNGIDWASAQAQVTNQTLIGDGIATQFGLIQSASANNVFVMINGVVQVPGDAYDTANSTMTFAEAPKVGDKIEVRFFSQTVSPVEDLPSKLIIDPAALIVGSTPVQIDSFNALTYRSAKYLVSITTTDFNVHATELLVVQNGALAVISRYGDVSTGGTTTYAFTADIVAGQCEIKASCSSANSSFKIQRFYTTI